MTKFDTLLKLASFLSMASVCAHTPQTIALLPSLHYALLIVDIFVTAFFTLEMILKVV